MDGNTRDDLSVSGQTTCMLKHLIKSAQVALFFSVILIVVLSGCSGRSDSNTTILKSIDDNIKKSTTTIYAGAERLLKELEEKTMDSATHRRANIWYPKALHIWETATGFNQYLDGLKSAIKDETNNPVINKAEELEKKFYSFQDALLTIDRDIDSIFRTSLLSFDESSKPNDGHIGKTFNNALGLEAKIMLGELQMIAGTNASRIIQFCNNKVGAVDGWAFFSTYGAFVGQSTTIAQEGESVEITAGLGQFNQKSKPIVIVEGKEVSVGDDGIARYAIIAGKRGKHKINVQVKYTNQETGLPDTVEKRIEYTVR